MQTEANTPAAITADELTGAASARHPAKASRPFGDRLFYEAMLEVEKQPEQRLLTRWNLAQLPATSPGDDVSAPFGGEELGRPALTPATVAAAIADAEAIRSDRDLNDHARHRKLTALAAELEEEVAEAPALLEAQLQTFLTKNAPPSAAVTPQVETQLATMERAVRQFLAVDALNVIEHSARAEPMTLDAVRSILRRLDQAPPRHFTKGDRERVTELLLTLPKGRLEVGIERWNRAVSLAESTRTRWLKELQEHVGTGRRRAPHNKLAED